MMNELLMDMVVGVCYDRANDDCRLFIDMKGGITAQDFLF